MKTKQTVSWVSLLPFYFIVLSLLQFQTRTWSEALASPVGLSQATRIIGIILALYFMFAFFAKKRLAIKAVPFPLIVYGLYILVGLYSSLLFSQWVGYSMWKLLEIVCVFFFGVYAVQFCRGNPIVAAQFHRTGINYVKFLIVSIVAGALLFPSLAFLPPLSSGSSILPLQLHGVLPKINPNSAGLLFAILAYISSLRLLQINRLRFVKNGPWFCIGLIGLILTQSRTALFSLIIVWLFTFLFHPRLKVGAKLACIVLLMPLVLYFLEPLTAYVSKGQSQELILSLSGRTTMWQFAARTFAEADFVNQVLGLGFSAANSVLLSELMGGTISTFHSDYVDALIANGVIGLALLLLFSGYLIGTATLGVLRNRTHLLAWEVWGIIAIIVLRSMTGTVVAFHNFFLILLILAAVNLDVLIKMKEAALNQSSYRRLPLPKPKPEAMPSGNDKHGFLE